MIVAEEDYLEYYGRKGMHWYEHIYGKEDKRAAYSNTVFEEKDIPTNLKQYDSNGKSYRQTKKITEDYQEMQYLLENGDIRTFMEDHPAKTLKKEVRFIEFLEKKRKW